MLQSVCSELILSTGSVSSFGVLFFFPVCFADHEVCLQAHSSHYCHNTCFFGTSVS
jgi:hypothetical protein